MGRRLGLLPVALFFCLPCVARGGEYYTPGFEAPTSLHQRLWGEPAPTRLHFGLWSYHPTGDYGTRRDIQKPHDLIAFTLRGFYAGTFINSYDDRVWGAGVHRSVARGGSGFFQFDLGYRLGLIHGYDERFLPLAGKAPVFPMFQVTLDASARGVGIQLSWAWSVVTAGFSFGF